ncbi:MAG: hypothetical protein KDD82_17035 [Planctomycetes bacterium]|nr:hypothetical protein [Planctomycetota bacterium]
MRSSLPVLLSLAFVGCTSQHYLVSSDSAPLYAAAADGEVLATLPRYAHGWVEGEAGSRLRVRAGERVGYLEARDARVFSVLDPVWDGGADLRAALDRTRRGLRVELEGDDWQPDAREAVAEGRIRKGMTQEQVEIAWGWPFAIEPDGEGDVWIYRRSGTSLQRVDSSYLFPYPFGFGVGWYGGRRGPYFGAVWQPYHRVRIEVPVVREYRVHFDRRGQVTGVARRSWIED